MHLVTIETPDHSEAFDSRDAGSRALAESAGLEGLEITAPGLHRLGALLPGGDGAFDVVDLNRALAVKLAFDDVGAPEVEADSLLPTDMLAFLAHGEGALRIAREALHWTVQQLARYDGPDLVSAGAVLPRRTVRIGAPVPRPGKILGVARNYAAHVQPNRNRVLPCSSPAFRAPANRPSPTH